LARAVKQKCPECGKGKARRLCHRKGHVEICSTCCATMRDKSCGDCVFYVETRVRELAKHSRPLPGGHFFAEVSDEIDEAVNAGLARAQRGEGVAVIRELEAMLVDHPRSHNLLFGIGTAHASLGRQRESIEWFERAIGIYPHCIEARINLAVAYQKLGDFSNAVRAHRKVLEFGDPRDPDVARSREFIDDVNAMLRAEHHGMSIDAFLKSADDFKAAFECMEQRKWDQAANLFKAVLKVNPRSVPAHGNLGLCFAQLGRKADAIAALNKALELDPEYQPALVNLRNAEKMEEGKPLEGMKFVERGELFGET
jgi:tetratricopeptide (TPR) repeat protein